MNRSEIDLQNMKYTVSIDKKTYDIPGPEWFEEAILEKKERENCRDEHRYPTRIHEICRMEPMIPFEFVCNGMKYTLVIEHEGHVWRLNHAKGRRMLAASIVCELVNHPERITRRPRLTEEQILALNAAVKWFGFKWLVMDKCESVCFWQNKPEKRENHWSAYGGGMYADIMTVKVDNLVSWSDPEPLNIVQTLRDAGVEVDDA